MPIGFSDLLKTTAQLDNNLTKGIVNTDETFGGVRSKIDNWTDLHLSTFNDGAGYTFQDDGTSAAPGHFKVYSTMFYVADGRSLVEDSTASSNFIRLDASGNYVGSGGTKYVVDSGDASPGYYVYKDATAVGGTGTGTDKLPKFTITGAQGSNTSTAIPAGYESFTSANNSSPAIEIVDTNEGGTYNLVFSTPGTDQVLNVDATTTALTYAPSTSTLTLGTQVNTSSLSTGTFGASGDIVTNLIPGNGSGVYAEKNLGSATLPWHELYVKDAIYFEGTANGFETQIVATDPTADNTITLPNASGTLAFENADTTGTAGALATAGTIEFTGDVQGGSTPTYTSGGDLSIEMTIQPDSVGLGDLVDIADERLLGRVHDSDGSVAALTKPQVLEMLNVQNGADVTGNNQAASAVELANGRTFKVSLGSSLASTEFDGTADIADIGVGGTLQLSNGGTGQTTQQAAINSLVGGAGSNNHVLLSDGTNVAMGSLPAAAVPTLNQNTTGSAAILTTGRTFKVALGSTDVSTAFNGSADITDVGVNGTLGVGNGGTGTTDSALFLNSSVTASSLGLVIGTHVQAFDAQLADVAGLTPTDSHFIVGDGTNFITETGGDARTSLGLGSIATQDANDVDISGGEIDGTAIGVNSASSGAFTTLSATGNLTVGGSLTVQGAFIQETSTNVIFEDTFLDLNVPDTATADITSDSGLRFGTAASTPSVLDKHAQLMYDATADKFKFTREADAGDFSAGQAKSGADNVAALKFTKTDTNTGQQDQANGTTEMDAADEANASSVRSLGAVAKCSITITSDAANDGDNYAPAEAGAVGYPIKHNLGTQSVFVVAIQTVNNSGSTMADPQPVYCKYIPEDDNTVRVSVGVTQVTEQYDIIVIG